jgi:hypothetical protein
MQESDTERIQNGLTFWPIIWVEVRQRLPPGLAPHINHTTLKAAPLLQAER